MPYAWGSRTAIAALQGRPTPSDGPEAELWMGAHPVAPSRIALRGPLAPGRDRDDEDREVEDAERSLADVVAADPEGELGAITVRELGPRLPFLLKVLAAAEPLSLQAHPTAERARAGFDEEERRGVPRGAPDRNYKDRSHKPELLCALTPFDALSGFRPVDELLRLFDALDVTELAPALAPLRASPDARGLAETFRALMTRPPGASAAAVSATVAACVTRSSELERAGFGVARTLAPRLARSYPGDVGVMSALLLEQVHLEPGEAIYLGAGNLHAYLEGTGVEIMASSDNVLRGGLTRKHVDVPELLRVLDFTPRSGPTPILRARPLPSSGHEDEGRELVYDTPAREFRLSRLEVAPPRSLTRQVAGPEILLVTEGSVLAAEGSGIEPGARGPVELGKGDAVFVPARTAAYTLEGRGTIFRATTGLSSNPSRS